jgi:hypothetical protein
LSEQIKKKEKRKKRKEKVKSLFLPFERLVFLWQVDVFGGLNSIETSNQQLKKELSHV